MALKQRRSRAARGRLPAGRAQFPKPAQAELACPAIARTLLWRAGLLRAALAVLDVARSRPQRRQRCLSTLPFRYEPERPSQPQETSCRRAVEAESLQTIS